GRRGRWRGWPAGGAGAVSAAGAARAGGVSAGAAEAGFTWMGFVDPGPPRRIGPGRIERGAGYGGGLAGVGLVGREAARRPIGYTPRRGVGVTGLTGYERVLVRAGLGPVAGIDEAGRGACAGPLVVAAVAIDRFTGDDVAGIADSKVLTAKAREAA